MRKASAPQTYQRNPSRPSTPASSTSPQHLPGHSPSAWLSPTRETQEPCRGGTPYPTDPSCPFPCHLQPQNDFVVGPLRHPDLPHPPLAPVHPHPLAPVVVSPSTPFPTAYTHSTTPSRARQSPGRRSSRGHTSGGRRAGARRAW